MRLFEAVLELRRRRMRRRMLGPRVLSAFAESHPTASFVEIGANDGRKHDHLRDYVTALPWRGVMVEPVPYVFDRLVANYGDAERVALVNAAVAERDGLLPFFHLRNPDGEDPGVLPDWYDGVGSFLREVVLSHAGELPDVEARIVERDVETLRFDTLLERHGLERVDLLLIDTEGYDARILRSIDLTRHRPRLIVYEHYHLDPDDRRATRELLESHGYETAEELFDTFCLRPGDGDVLDRTWQRRRPALPGISRYERAAA